MDKYNISGILKEIDTKITISNHAYIKLHRYIDDLIRKFRFMHLEYNKGFLFTVKKFFKGLELKTQICKFVNMHTTSLVNYIDIKYSLMIEYLIHDILDMMYVHTKIHSTTPFIHMHSFSHVLNNDVDFKQLNNRYEIIILEPSQHICYNNIKNYTRQFTNKILTDDMICLLRDYIQYVIDLKLEYIDSIKQNG